MPYTLSRHNEGMAWWCVLRCPQPPPYLHTHFNFNALKLVAPAMMFSSKGFLTRLSVILLASVIGLSGCTESKIAKERVSEDTAKADQALQRISPTTPIAQPLMVDKSPYYGSQAVPITNGTALPVQFEQPGAVVMTFARPVSMPELMRMVQAVTGMRATVSGHAPSTGNSGGSDAGPASFLPSDGEQVAGGRVVWQGRLSDLLNQAADTFGADWRYNGNTIDFAQQITRTFMLHALASELSVKGTVKSGSSGDSNSNLPEVDVTSTSSMKVWEEIKEAVATIMGDSGKAAFSPSTGTITVTGAPDTVRQVESYLNQQNAMRLRRVAVAIKVITIAASNDLDLSADLTGIIKRAFDQASVRTVGEASSGIAIGVLKAPLAGTDLTDISSDRLVTELRANKGIKRASVTHSGAIVTLSDQPAPLQVGKQISYLKRTSSTSGDSGGGSVSLEPGTINTGLMMTILPRIVESNRILMRISVAITDAQKPFATFGSGTGANAIQIQLPEVETTGFLQNAVMTSGETLVLAGFEKNQNSATESGAPGTWLLGGENKTSRTREITVLMLTSEILPEDPISVIGQ